MSYRKEFSEVLIPLLKKNNDIPKSILQYKIKFLVGYHKSMKNFIPDLNMTSSYAILVIPFKIQFAQAFIGTQIPSHDPNIVKCETSALHERETPSRGERQYRRQTFCGKK